MIKSSLRLFNSWYLYRSICE